MTRSRTNDRDDDLRDALRPRIRALLDEMWAREAGARSFGDPEGVHQMRVASRKVRSALDAAGPLFAGKRFRRVRKGVRRLTRALGRVRDGDVMLMDLERIRSGAGTGRHPGIDRVMHRLERERERERERLLATLDELDDDGFREWSVDAFPGGKERSIRRRDARRMVEGHIAEFLSHTGEIPPEEEVAALHEIRIITKRLRYALQLFREPLAPEGEAVIEALTEMQDQLGEIHNLDVLIGLVRAELHQIADDAIDLAVSKGTTADEDGQAAWNDLVGLVIQVAAERHERYARFVAWWQEMRTSEFPEQIEALTRSR